MKKALHEYYNQEFYSTLKNGSINSAKVILNLLYNFYQPQSVIDIGCGQGEWLTVAESLGSKKLIGLDGHWIKKEYLLNNSIEFRAVDFEKNISIKENYDLCISVEVAEHLSQDRSNYFINLLCSVSDVVVFSAAIKYQGGDNHINEQWQSYWINLFDNNGYHCFDIFRKEIWNNEEVLWWYRQNTFLFVKKNTKLINIIKSRFAENNIPDIVHPKNYESKVYFLNDIIKYPTLRFCLGCLKRYMVNKIRNI